MTCCAGLFLISALLGMQITFAAYSCYFKNNMRFSAPTASLNKLAGVAATLMILPVAVACGPDTAADTDITSEVSESTEGNADLAPGTSTGSLEAIDSGESIVEVASADGSFDTLVAAVQAAGLEEKLSEKGPYTVFAPTDEAFAALPEGTVEKLVKPENQEALNQILAYHVVSGAIASSEIQPGAVSTVEGENLEISIDPAGVMVNGSANVVQPDIVATNGVIHVVDTVLLPPTLDLATLI